MRISIERRFTLIELLVALVIASFMLGLAAYGLGLAARMLRDLDLPAAEETRLLSAWRDSVGGAIYYVCQRPRLAGSADEYFFYFYAQANELRYITAKPLAVNGPALCRIFAENGQLVVEECPLYDKAVDFKNPEFPSSGLTRTVLVEKVSACDFECLSRGQAVRKMSEQFPELVIMRFVQEGRAREVAGAIRSDCHNRCRWAEQIMTPDQS